MAGYRGSYRRSQYRRISAKHYQYAPRYVRRNWIIEALRIPLALALIAGIYFGFPLVERELRFGHYEWADVHHVYDGDTLTVIRTDANGSTEQRRVRLLDIDTAELGGAQCDAERELALQQRDYLISLVGNRVQLYVTGTDRYGRLLAEVYNEAGENVSDRMLEEARARRYSGGYRDGWC